MTYTNHHADRDDRAATNAHAFVDRRREERGPLYDARRSMPAPKQHGRHVPTPERRLMAAVLAEAIADYHRYAGDHRRGTRTLFRMTRDWFASTNRSAPYSFETICSVLDIDADLLRARLLLPIVRAAACERGHRGGQVERRVA